MSGINTKQFNSLHIFYRLVPGLLLALMLSACGGGSGDNTGTNNTLPTANAGADQSVNEGANVQLSGSGSDAEGTVSFHWRQSAGAAVTLSDTTLANPVFNAPILNNASSDTLVFELTVTDSDGASVTDSISVTVNDVSTPLPMPDAGADQTVMSGQQVSLNANASGNNPPFMFSWAQTAGTSVTLSDTTIANPTFTAPTVASGNSETLSFEVTVTDAASNLATDQVSITVSGQAVQQSRITRIEYDYDNNGITDAIADFTYDNAGRLVREVYQYTDDGTADLFVAVDETRSVTDFNYDAQGRVSSHKRVDEDNGGTEFEYTYDTASGLLARADVTTTNTSGLITSQTFYLFGYTGNQRTSADIHLLANGNLLLDIDYSYDANGRLITETARSASGLSQYVGRFSWDANGRLTLHEVDSQDDGSVDNRDENIFDQASGRLVQRINDSFNQFTRPYGNYTEHFGYDGNGLIETIEYDKDHDGSMDATARATQRENGPCATVYIPVLLPQVGQDGDPGTGTGDLAWCQ